MSNIVEVLEKLSKPKSVNMSSNFNRSKRSLKKDELFAAVCSAGNKNPLGVAILMATEFDDLHQSKVLQEYLSDKLGGGPRGKALMTIVYAELCFLPLGNNQKRIKSLFKRYGARANRSRRLIDSWKKANKSLLASGKHQDLIDKREQDIKTERLALDRYADKYSRLSCYCPRCGGTGRSQIGLCLSCQGKGFYKNAISDWKAQLKPSKIKLDSDTLLEIYTAIDDLNVEKYAAIKAMETRLQQEKAY